MFKKQYLALAIAATLAAGAAQAALETSVTLKNETAYMLKDGIRTGEATTYSDTVGEGKGVYKFENTAQIYLNDELGQGSSWHGELKITRDSKAVNNLDGHESYSQQDWLRELYADTTLNDWDFRLGKQQVVWGTADGMKLLDMINPTDWREINQNTMSESRIPVWMINGEKYLDDGSNIQVIFSQAKPHKIAGMPTTDLTRTNSTIEGVDSGAPFIMKGVDSITGRVNGFLNVAPALARVATTFDGAAQNAGFVTVNGAEGVIGSGGVETSYSATLANFFNMTVDYFATGTWDTASVANKVLQSGQKTCSDANSDGTVAASECVDYGDSGTPTSGNGITVLGQYAGMSNSITNLVNSAWGITNPDSAFEYMPMTTFSTFNSLAGMTSRYVKDLPKDLDSNFATRFRATTDKGLNYSLAYAYRYDSNPYIDLDYYDRSSGAKLTAEYWGGAGGTGIPTGGTQRTASTVDSDASNETTSVMLTDGSNYYGSTAWSASGGSNAYNDVELRFTEKLARVHSIGGAFDFAIDSGDQSYVVRAEALYNKGEMKPVVDKRLLAIGDLAGALDMQEADMFKYVIGLDTTIMTDMMISGQFIQERNLDYIDQSRTCTNQTTSTFNCDKYTADMGTLHMSNQLQKGYENKEFYSLFLSKPFGESGEGRWNNIFMYEEGGGKWNRFDVEYGFDDQLIGTFEVNKYFGDENTMFGQFENASNVQIGVKYLLQ